MEAEPQVAASLEPGEIRRALSEVQDLALAALSRYVDARLQDGGRWRERADGVDLAAVLKMFTEAPHPVRERLLPAKDRDAGRHHRARSLASICLEHRNRLAHARLGTLVRADLLAEVASDFGRLLIALGWERDAESFVQHAHGVNHLMYVRRDTPPSGPQKIQPIESTKETVAAAVTAGDLRAIIQAAIADEMEKARSGDAGTRDEASTTLAALHEELRRVGETVDRLTREQAPVAIAGPVGTGVPQQDPLRERHETAATNDDGADAATPHSVEEPTRDAPAGGGSPAEIEPATRSRRREPHRVPPTPLPAAPGAKWAFAAGVHAYSLRADERDVRDHINDRWLSDAIGHESALRVANRLLVHRPEGGTIRVDSDGDVTTQRRSGGGRFYLGRVGPLEWFDGVVEDQSEAVLARSGAGVQESFDSILVRLQELGHSAAQVAEHAAFAPETGVAPGERWPFAAGEHTYSLRARERDVRDYGTETWLSDHVGSVTARRVADRLLQHRPEGGTIRVDDDGDVSSQRRQGGGRFYLGRVSPTEWFPGVIGASPESSNATTLPTPGSPWPYEPGAHSYSLLVSGPDVRDNTPPVRRLSDVIGRTRAQEVARTLLRFRPEGGVVHVDVDGDVSTERARGSGRFYLGRVLPADWFPGVIEA